MKAHLLVMLLALGACGKKNDLPILQHEAGTLAKYYQPKLEELDQRIQAIMKRGQTIPADFPGVKEVGLQLQEARDQVAKLRGVVGSPSSGQKSAVESQADAAAKDGKIADLRKLLHDTELMLDHGMTLITSDLDAVESWIYHYDHKTLAMNTASPTGEQPGQPETPATGQPPAAGAQGSAAPAQGSAAPAAQGSAASPQPAQPTKQPSQAKPGTIK
jgi:hypothetical protein